MFTTLRATYSLDDEQSVKVHYGAGSDHESSSSEGQYKCYPEAFCCLAGCIYKQHLHLQVIYLH